METLRNIGSIHLSVFRSKIPAVICVSLVRDKFGCMTLIAKSVIHNSIVNQIIQKLKQENFR
jgi:hypothetical protein